MEIFKHAKDYENIYEVSNLGNVKSLRTNKILKQYTTSTGYKTVALFRNSNDYSPKSFYVHRLIAQTFITNNDNLLIVVLGIQYQLS